MLEQSLDFGNQKKDSHFVFQQIFENKRGTSPLVSNSISLWHYC